MSRLPVDNIKTYEQSKGLSPKTQSKEDLTELINHRSKMILVGRKKSRKDKFQQAFSQVSLPPLRLPG